MQINEKHPDELSRLLETAGEFIFRSRAEEYWAGCAAEVREELCRSAVQYRLEPFLYYYLWKVLPPERKTEFQKAGRAVSQNSLPLFHQFDSIRKLLNENSIRFVPFKGAELAREVYPDLSLRLMGDLDILIHPGDIDRAIALLRADGWTGDEFRYDHHFAPLERKGVNVEIHFDLPGFHSEEPAQFWKECRKTGNAEEHRLSPELNLLLQVAHAAGHEWHNGMKLLLDLAFLIRRETIDWNRVELLAKRFGVLSPAPLLAVVPELFRHAPGLPEFRGEIPEAIRNDFLALLGENCVFPQSSWLILMNEPGRFSPKWWRTRLKGLRPQVLYVRYHLEKGHPWQLFLCACRDGMRKAGFAVRSLRKRQEPQMQSYLKRRTHIKHFFEGFRQ